MATTNAAERAQAAEMRSGEGGGPDSGAVDMARFPPVEIEVRECALEVEVRACACMP